MFTPILLFIVFIIFFPFIIIRGGSPTDDVYIYLSNFTIILLFIITTAPTVNEPRFVATTNIYVHLLIAPCCSRCRHRRSQYENVLATALAIDEIVYFDTEQNCTIGVIFLLYL